MPLWEEYKYGSSRKWDINMDTKQSSSSSLQDYNGASNYFMNLQPLIKLDNQNRLSKDHMRPILLLYRIWNLPVMSIFGGLMSQKVSTSVKGFDSTSKWKIVRNESWTESCDLECWKMWNTDESKNLNWKIMYKCLKQCINDWKRFNIQQISK